MTNEQKLKELFGEYADIKAYCNSLIRNGATEIWFTKQKYEELCSLLRIPPGDLKKYKGAVIFVC